jgi:hypothetical protein
LSVEFAFKAIVYLLQYINSTFNIVCTCDSIIAYVAPIDEYSSISVGTGWSDITERTCSNSNQVFDYKTASLGINARAVANHY